MADNKPIRLHPTRVTHKVTHDKGWALEFNGSKSDPAYWVKFTPSGHSNWYKVDDVEQGWLTDG